MSESKPVLKVNGQTVAVLTGAVWRERGSAEVHVTGEVDEAMIGAMIIGSGVESIETDAEADQLFGKGSQANIMAKAGLCAASGHRNRSGSCSVCSRRRQEAARGDWFAAEERQER